MFRRFNDISIRGKLIVIVSGAVAILTTGVLISVWVSARKQVNQDVYGELHAARAAFSLSQGEHLHEQVLEAEAIADSDKLQDLLTGHDQKAACDWTEALVTGKDAPVNPEDAYDMVAIALPDGKLFAVSINGDGKRTCSPREMRWRLPLAKEIQQPQITNWESRGERFYEFIQAPVIDEKDREIGTFVLGFKVGDAMARHIKEHTGQKTILWHAEENQIHIIGASDEFLKGLLSPGAFNPQLGSEISLKTRQGEYSILDAAIEDQADPMNNPMGLHVALVQSLDEKYRPFRQLEFSLVFLACLALSLGLVVGMFLSRPIATPLVTLANAAESVASGKLEMADSLMRRNPGRLDAKDEIGTLGRSFMRMIQDLKERLAMATFLSQATFKHIRSQSSSGSTSERTSMAILFSDVRQFSSFSETRDPAVVIQLLNQVLSLEAEVVGKHEGDIDKFVGDALIAWFSGEDRCRRAVQAAQEMIGQLQARFGGQPGTTIGIGIHVGEVVVGSVGSSARKDYTAIGSVVNLAARLCSSARAGQILISQAVADELGNNAKLNPLPPISPKGFSGPVAVFEVSLNQKTASA